MALPFPFHIIINFSRAMRANIILVKALTIFVILLIGCNKEAERDFARLITLDASDITVEGAILNARITNLNANSTAVQCGFIIYNGPPSTLTNKGLVEAEPDMESGTIMAKAELGMKNGVEYFYTGYVYDGTTMVIGNVMSFTSLGGKAANIISMEPTKGSVSDTVVLRLSGPIGDVSGLTVKFDNKTAQIVDFRNDVLRVIVPNNLTIKDNPVSITTGTTTNIFATKFELNFPEITDFEPTEAYPGETITINGLNFDPLTSRNVVKFNSTVVTVVSSSTTQIKVIAPDLQGVDCQISITIGTLVATANGVIKIKNLPAPLITSFDPVEVYPGEIVTITGLYFNADPALNIVKFNSTIAQVVSSNYTQIEVLSPDLQGVDCQISVTVGAQTVVASGQIKILTWPVYWTRMNDHPAGNIYKMGTFVVGDYGYTGLGAKVPSSYNNKFWRYDYSGDSWMEVALFPGSTRVYPFGFTIGGKGYIGSGSSLDNSSGVPLRDFYEYNPVTNSWTKLNDYPGNVQKGFVGWSEVLNDKAFVTFSNMDFYSYVPSANLWTKLPNPPGQLYSNPASFVIGNIIYVIGGVDISNNYKSEVWAYNTSDKTWTRKKDFPGGTRRAAVGLSIEGICYSGLGYNSTTTFKDFWKYYPQSDSWGRMPDFAGAARAGAHCLVINKMAYIGTGYLSSMNLASDIYRFNPSAQK